MSNSRTNIDFGNRGPRSKLIQTLDNGIHRRIMKKKEMPKKVLLETPSFTEWPLGQLKYTIVLLSSDPYVGRVMKGEICMSKRG